MSNLKNAFPEKSPSEISAIASTSYRNLADIMVEGIKGASMSEKQIRSRYKFLNPDLIQTSFSKGKSVILVAGHYRNWEWAALSPPLFFDHHIVALYKRLHNKHLNEYMKNTRSGTGETLYELRETADAFANHAKQNPPAMFLLAADQSPSNTENSHWIDFLNQDTPCLHGPEKYARMYDLPVVFSYPKRMKRGFYELEMEWLVDDPKNYKEGEITKAFMNRLEEVILDAPGGWLWSHKRWKHKR